METYSENPPGFPGSDQERGENDMINTVVLSEMICQNNGYILQNTEDSCYMQHNSAIWVTLWLALQKRTVYTIWLTASTETIKGTTVLLTEHNFMKVT